MEILEQTINEVKEFLRETRALKKMIKKCSEAHDQYFRKFSESNYEYSKNVSKTSRIMLIGYSDYINSYTKYISEVFEETKSAYSKLKRLTAELKHRLKLLKIDQKNISTSKDFDRKKNFRDYEKRCSSISQYIKDEAYSVLKSAIDSHLFSLKRFKNIKNPQQDSLDFSAELSRSTKKLQNSEKSQKLKDIFSISGEFEPKDYNETIYRESPSNFEVNQSSMDRKLFKRTILNNR